MLPRWPVTGSGFGSIHMSAGWLSSVLLWLAVGSPDESPHALPFAGQSHTPRVPICRRGVALPLCGYFCTIPSPLPAIHTLSW
jgi:hypothetical protein